MSEFTPKLTPEEQSLLVEIFSTGMHLGEISRPLAGVSGTVDQQTYDVVKSIGYEVFQDQRPMFAGLEKINPEVFKNWPRDVVDELRALGQIARDARSCGGIGDLGLYYAKTDIYEVCRRGWQGVSRDAHVGELTWAIDDAAITSLPAVEATAEVNVTVQDLPRPTEVQAACAPAIDAARPFTNPELVFFEDRVELMGVVICRGKRQRSRRIFLELLCRRNRDGVFLPRSGEELTAELIERGVKGGVIGIVRDLRKDIRKSLFNAKQITCDPTTVIVSKGQGYRFADGVTVRFERCTPIVDIMDTASGTDVHVGVHDRVQVRDHVDVHDGLNEDALNAVIRRRRKWIMEQLKKDVQLKKAMVAERFRISIKSAQRLLDALRGEKKIKFVGSPRTGYYKLVPPKHS